MGQRSRILVVDDDPASRDLLRRVLATEGHEVHTASDGREALAELARQPADLVVSDIRMPDLDGVQLLQRLQELSPNVPVILVTAFGDVEGAVEAIRRGAFDYLAKPYDVDAIRHLVRRALAQAALTAENRDLRRQVREKYRLEGIVGRSEPMLQVFKTAARVAQSDATVLIEGESGTGKELVARAIHAASPLAPTAPSCRSTAAPSPRRAGIELFGHARGAFTGAQADAARPVRGGRRRNPLPGRDGRRRPGAASPAPARPAGGRDSAGWAPTSPSPSTSGCSPPPTRTFPSK